MSKYRYVKQSGHTGQSVLFFVHDGNIYRIEPGQEIELPDCPQVKMLVLSGTLEEVEVKKERKSRGDK